MEMTERERRRAGSVSRGPHSYISRETKTERSLGRGANLLSFRCRRSRNRKTHRQPVFFSLFARPPFSPGDLGRPVVRSPYVRQCRGTAAERGRAPRNDLRLGRDRFGPARRFAVDEFRAKHRRHRTVDVVVTAASRGIPRRIPADAGTNP